MVHREAPGTYAEVLAELEDITAEAVRALGRGDPVVLNASPYQRTEVVGGGLVTVPGLGSAPVTDTAADEARAEQDGDTILLENSRLRVRIDRDGLPASVHDLTHGREVLCGPGNLLKLHPEVRGGPQRDLVVRLYESRGGRARAELTPGFSVSRAEVTDLLERPPHESPLVFELRPFQILTLRLKPA